MSPRHLRRLVSSAIAGLLLSVSAAADDYDDLGGFGEDEDEFSIDLEEELGPEDGEHESPRWWDVDGSVAISSSINYLAHDSATGTDYTGLSRLRTRLNLQLDVDLPYGWKLRVDPYLWYDFSYPINGRSNFSSEVLDEYEWEGDVQDTWVQGPLFEDVDLKIGRQVVNWGRSDSLRVLDVLNPLDNRVPGLADIDDLRWAVGMAKLDWYIGSHWTLTAIAIPEIRVDTLPAFGSDFNPSPVPAPPGSKPKSFENWEAAAAVRGIFEGWDISANFAYVFEDIPRLELVPSQPNPCAGVPPGPGSFIQVYDRLTLAGAGGNYTFGSWLLKAEAAWTGGFEFTCADDKKSRFEVMGGVEYYGLSESILVLEIGERHIFDYEGVVGGFPTFEREDSLTYAFRYSADWLNARLSTTLLAIAFGWKAQDGAILRLQGDYAIQDGLALTVGVLLYREGELPPLDTWGRNDRAFIDLKWSF